MSAKLVSSPSSTNTHTHTSINTREIKQLFQIKQQRKIPISLPTSDPKFGRYIPGWVSIKYFLANCTHISE